MDYYIFLPGDTEDTAMYDSNHLGCQSFNTLWPGSGLGALMKIANDSPDLLEQCHIRTSAGGTLSIEEFLEVLDKLHIAKG